MKEPSRTDRRQFLGAGLALCAGAGAPGCAWAHRSFGPVRPPQTVPDLSLMGADGRARSLAAALRGHVTALHLMFTTCSATCPIQGAVFATVQRQLARAEQSMQLLSVSIDPLGDDPNALQAWLKQFGAEPTRWTAAVPRLRDVDGLLDFLRGRAAGADRHSQQVFVMNRRAEMAYRSGDLASAEQVIDAMRKVSEVSAR